MWVWGQGGASAEQDSRSVKPALIPELQEQWPPRGHDGQPWVFFGAQYMRDLPYGMLDHTKLMSCCHEWTHGWLDTCSNMFNLIFLRGPVMVAYADERMQNAWP